MKRRKFLASAAVSSLFAPYALKGSSHHSQFAQSREIYDLRCYELSFGGNRSALMSFLKEIREPQLKKMGVNQFMMFTELGQSEPAKLWTLTAFPEFGSYEKAMLAEEQPEFVENARAYSSAGKTYNRIVSSLLYAFEGFQQMKPPLPDGTLFELRIYEGVNEDAVRRKVRMFNVEELDLFDRIGLHGIFYGQMLAGPYVPSLVYMLNYKDLNHRDTAWKEFLEHPEWNVMKVKPEYANTVSNIHKVFLNRV